MAAVLHNISSTLIPQPDFRAQQDDKGTWTASQSFLIKKGTLATAKRRFITGARATTLDPDCEASLDFLKLTTWEVANEVGGMTRIVVNYSGRDPKGTQAAPAGNDGEDPFPDSETNEDNNSSEVTAEYGEETIEEIVPTRSLRGTLTNLPLSTHPKWKALSATEKFALGQIMNGGQTIHPTTNKVGSWGDYVDESILIGDKVTKQVWGDLEYDGSTITLSGDALTFAQMVLQCETTWESSAFEFRKTWTSRKEMTPQQLNALGKIVAASGAPAPGGGRNYKLSGVNQEQTGIGKSAIFRCEALYQLSQPGGFSDFLYGQ